MSTLEEMEVTLKQKLGELGVEITPERHLVHRGTGRQLKAKWQPLDDGTPLLACPPADPPVHLEEALIEVLLSEVRKAVAEL